MQNCPTRCQRPGCGGRIAVAYGMWVCQACGHGPEAKIYPRPARKSGKRRIGPRMVGEDAARRPEQEGTPLAEGEGAERTE